MLVTNGIYQSGGDSFGGSNRVDTVNSVALQSVNGPAVTIIKGYQVPGTTNGPDAVRCVYLREFSTLSGFTLTGGATQSSGAGGGVEMESQCVVSNCIIAGNAADAGGGGAYNANGSLLVNCVISGNVCVYGGGQGGGASGCVLNHCVVSNNLAVNGGGVYNCTVYDSLLVGNGNTNSVGGTSGGAADFSKLYDCTIAGNFSHGLGAADGCTLVNSIIYGNANNGYADCYMCVLSNCCTTLGLGTPSLPNNSISNDPAFVNPAGGDYHLLPFSPCINAGTNSFVTNSVDLDRNPRIVNGTVDMGCYESQFTNLVHYVSLTSTNPISPFTNWLTAATNIQDAVAAAQSGDFVVANDGAYTNGGPVVYGTETNRVALTNSITLLSVNGPAVTTIVGGAQTRCVYVGANAVLSGFTLTNGSAATNGDLILEQSGGGAWCESPSAIVSNCIIAGNTAHSDYGGGAFGGTLINCLLTNNLASYGGGAASNILINCTLTKNLAAQHANGSAGVGGGASFSTLMGCMVSNNVAYQGGGANGGVIVNSLVSSNKATYGGGAYSDVLNNCLLKNNHANFMGGGADGCALVNCSVVSNTATQYGGGIAGGSATNCIIYYNSASFLPPNSYFPVNITYCCTTPDPGSGFGNITNDPAFVNLAGGDFHLQTNSPCINSGNNAYVSNSTDFDGHARIAGGTVDMGAYEFQSPSSILSYAWAQQYGLPTDGSADFADTDDDGMNNWQEWIAGTNPTNAASLLQMASAVPTNNFSGVIVTWQSVTNVTYFLQRGSDLSAQPVFTAIQSNIVGQAGTTSYQDTTATNSGPYFYRVGVQ